MIRIANLTYATSQRLNFFATRIAALCFGAMLCVMMLQVVARYAFASPPFWTEELARWLMVWGGLLGASAAFHTHADPAMVHPPSHVIWRQKVQVVARFLASWTFFAPVLWFTWPYLERQIGRTSEGLEISTALMASALPVALVLILFHGLAGLGALISPKVLEEEIAFAKSTESNMLE